MSTNIAIVATGIISLITEGREIFEEAAKAYNNAAIKYHKEFANLNII